MIKNVSDVSSLLFSILSNPSLPSILLNDILELLALFSQSAGSSFVPYANDFMKGIRNIIFSDGLASIRASAVVCIGCLAEVSKNSEVCESVFKEILGIVGLNETVDIGFIESIPQFVECLKEKFYPYAFSVMGLVFAQAGMEIRRIEGKNQSKIQVLASFQLKNEQKD